MTSYTFLLVLAIILLSTKVLGLASGKVKMPQVVGALVAGLILGPSVLNLVIEDSFISVISEIGVIMLMFAAGLETDLQELKKTGLASFVIACAGVIVPLLGGTGLYLVFFNGEGDPQHFLKAIFVGVILTATSVSITVETLRELGKLKGRVGTAILGAAVIDDILGIVVLTVVSSFTNPDVQIGMVLLKIVLFFVFIAIVGFLVYKYFKHLSTSFAKKMHRRVAIYALAFCFLLSYCAEQFFGVADITGAYFAGLLLCNLSNIRDYVARKIDICSYMLFAPVFFASVGIKTNLAGLTPALLLFAVLLLVIAILSKIIGCGLGAKLCKFSSKEALSVGVGMVSRGEVALIVAQKGAAVGLVPDTLFAPVILVVIVTTLITPILLKMVMSDKQPDAAAKT
ncbi:cation:proton antiporter [Butyricicoccus sp.]|uniref:cation:proton antiporter n=1 Tax=Butyricicoccus sp. TaxID=2049021 RepID=UPI0037353B96